MDLSTLILAGAIMIAGASIGGGLTRVANAIRATRTKPLAQKKG